MKKLLIILALLLLCGCAKAPMETSAPETTVPVTTVPETTVPETSVPETTVPETTVPSEPEYPLEDVLTWFDEVVLQVEYTDGTGDPSLVQKWLAPISYRIDGEPTDEDLAVLEDFFAQLNRLPGFPGIYEAAEEEAENLTLSFLGPEEFQNDFSDAVNGEDAWGAAQFWYYTDTNELHTARIGYRTDIDQASRNSIILEEIVNCLGITDTVLREDSIVYQYSNDNLALSDEDWLILELLYSPEIRPGMGAEECHAIIEDICG